MHDECFDASIYDKTINSQRSLCFPMSSSQVLLGMKIDGWGSGNYNGFGGKFDSSKGDVTIEDTAVRELQEESLLITTNSALSKRAIIDFYFMDPSLSQRVHVYFVDITDCTGKHGRTDEMDPVWFDKSSIPYDKMWDSDRIWFKRLMDTGSNIYAKFYWKKDTVKGKYFFAHYDIVDVDILE